jgi:tetratricopeptide (TPR) repeat protein
LDNARDPEHVRPLLPGCSGCLVVVTSRNQLTGLVAAQGAHPLRLDLLSAAEARQLMKRRLGAERVDAEPGPVTDIIERCAGLPLALAVVAARAATYPEFTLAAIAAELRAGMDRFASGDGPTDLWAVFSSSYRALGPPAQRLFRLLALHPGPDITAPAVASLIGLPPGQARRQLAELTRTHLLTEHQPGRFAFHDLLRAYATDLAGSDERDERRDAQHRMLDHYLHTAHAAALLFDPHRAPLTTDPPAPKVAPESMADHPRAEAWFTAEHPILVNLVRWADGQGLDLGTYQLAWSLQIYLHWRGHFHDCLDTQHTALGAVRRLGDPALQARVHRVLAGIYTNLGRYPEAHSHLDAANDMLGTIADQYGQGQTELAFGRLWISQGHHRKALYHHECALERFKAVGNVAWQSRALNALGWSHANLGEYDRAISVCREALAIQGELGDRHSQGMTLDTIGYAHHHLGQHEHAVDCYERALALHREVGDVRNEADTLQHLGDTHHETGKKHKADSAWQRSLTIFDRLNDPDADVVRAKLRSTSA